MMTLADREAQGSALAAFDAALLGQTARLRMMERWLGARCVDEDAPGLGGEGFSFPYRRGPLRGVGEEEG